LFFPSKMISIRKGKVEGWEGGDLLRFRNAWEVPPNSIVRSNVRVAVTLAATLKSVKRKQIGGKRDVGKGVERGRGSTVRK
jgi:hypothetical protein